MTGYHEVKAFFYTWEDVQAGVAMPENYKPFSSKNLEEGVVILCRKWRRQGG